MLEQLDSEIKHIKKILKYNKTFITKTSNLMRIEDFLILSKRLHISMKICQTQIILVN